MCKFSYVQICATLWILAHHAPLSMGFSREEYRSVVPFPSPGDLPKPEIVSESLKSLILANSLTLLHL